jgi:AbiV family abortive infection protein
VTKKRITIPTAKISEGIDLCLINASQFCKDARLLNSKSSHAHALGLCVYALEELGKADLLQMYSDFAKQYDIKEITIEKKEVENFFYSGNHQKLIDKFGFFEKINPFYDHRYKLLKGSGRAFQVVDWGKLLSPEEKQNINSFNEFFKAIEKKDYYEIDIKEQGFRQEVMYVDYNREKNKWIHGTKFSQKDIDNLIEDITRAIELFNKDETHIFRSD